MLPVRFGQGLFEDLGLPGEFTSDVDVALPGVNRIGGDDHPLKKTMGHAGKKDPILESPRFTFVRVAEKKLGHIAFGNK